MSGATLLIKTSKLIDVMMPVQSIVLWHSISCTEYRSLETISNNLYHLYNVISMVYGFNRISKDYMYALGEMIHKLGSIEIRELDLKMMQRITPLRYLIDNGYINV